MTLETLNVVYTCFIVGGFVVPVLDVAMGLLGGALGAEADIDLDADVDVDLDLDVEVDLDVDLDTDVDLSVDAPPVSGGVRAKTPVNVMTLSLGAVMFGALGRLLLYKVPVWLGLYIAAQIAILAAFLLGRYVILPLKRNRAYATGIRHMVGVEGRVTLEAREDFTGTVEVRSATGSQVTYSARPVEGVSKICKGESVSVVAVDEERMLCIVRPLEDKE